MVEDNEEVEEYPYLGNADNPIISEGVGPLLWFKGITKTVGDAFFAKGLKELGVVVTDVAKDWAGGQVADKVAEHVEDTIDETIQNKPLDSPAPSSPVDLGNPAMGTSPETSEPADLGVPEDSATDWDPSADGDSDSLEGQPNNGWQIPGLVETASPDDSSPASTPVDMGMPQMGVPAESPAAPPPDNSVMLPPDNTSVETPPWDPGADASWLPSPPEPAPIPMAVPPDE